MADAVAAHEHAVALAISASGTAATSKTAQHSPPQWVGRYRSTTGPCWSRADGALRFLDPYRLAPVTLPVAEACSPAPQETPGIDYREGPPHRLAERFSQPRCAGEEIG